MKLSDIRKLRSGLPASELYQAQILDPDFLRRFGLEYGNLYQELEMDSPYVDTHQDISYSNSQFQFHSHNFYEILCCRNTCGAEYLIGSDRYKLQKGDIIVVPPDISHRPLLSEHLSEPYSRDVLWVSTEFVNQLLQNFPNINYSNLKKPTLYRTVGTRWVSICTLFREGVLEAERCEPGWEALVLANTVSILTHLSRASLDIHAKPLRAEKPELLDQVLAYIELHLSERITLSEMAHQFYVSESTISQTFRKKMGVSFYRCVTQRRLIASKTLIEKGLSLESISEQVGFSDYSSFFRAFKQEYGISPRQYRKLQISDSAK